MTQIKLKRVPFDLELAKKITNKEEKGHIVTRDGRQVRIICFDKSGIYPIVALIQVTSYEEAAYSFSNEGAYSFGNKTCHDLCLEVPNQNLKTELKPFEKVLVRDRDSMRWKSDLFSYTDIENRMYVCVGSSWRQCIPYEGNEDLLGTVNKS